MNFNLIRNDAGIKFLSAAILIFSSVSCIKKCDPHYYYVDNELLAYAPVISPGYSWIYENTTGSKRDSIFLESGYSHYFGPKEECDQFEGFSGNLHSEYIFGGTSILASIGKGSISENGFALVKPNDARIIILNYDSENHNFLNGRGVFIHKDSVLIGDTYFKDCILDTALKTVYAKNIGIVYFIDPINQQDTFRLKNFFKP